MFTRHEQRMTGKQRAVIKKSKRVRVFVNDDRRNFAGHNPAKQTVFFCHRKSFLSNKLLRATTIAREPQRACYVTAASTSSNPGLTNSRASGNCFSTRCRNRSSCKISGTIESTRSGSDNCI